jgi:acetyl-CoA acetyltransferase
MVIDGSWGHAVALDDVAGVAAIVGVGESDMTAASGRTAKQIALAAIEQALDDAGLSPREVDGFQHQPGGFGDQLTVEEFRDYFGITGELWSSPTGGGMRWAATAPHDAAVAIRDGRASVVVNNFAVAWATQRADMTGGPGQAHADEQFKQQLEVPFGWFPQPVYFATIARRHMHQYGTTERQLGHIAVACRTHANRTPSAVMHDRVLTLDRYLSSRYLAEPFRKEDCCLISDGGGALVVTSVERARDLRKPVVEVAGVGLGRSHTGTHWAQQRELTATPQVFAAPGAFAMAGVQAGDVDVFTCYDPFTIVTLMQLEDMGFCAKGDGGPFVESTNLLNDGGRAVGGLPIQTHGGLLSHAYVLGIAHVVECVRQLRGEAAAQVANAEVAVYGGYTGPEAATLVLRRAR